MVLRRKSSQDALLEWDWSTFQMSLTLTVPEEIAAAAEQLAATSGTTPEALLIAALKAHFPPVPLALQEEFEAWERASDEDMARIDEVEGLADS
jgi:hypothetical protein